MTPSTRPWGATLTARLARARDVDVTEVIEVRHGEFTRRLVGGRGPVSAPPEPLDARAREELLADLRREIENPPIDVDPVDLAEFAGMLERSLEREAAPAG